MVLFINLLSIDFPEFFYSFNLELLVILLNSVSFIADSTLSI